MKFAIIAAGEGSRLAQEGIVSPKPLIEVAGQHLIDRLMDVFREVGASELWVVCNDLRPEVSAHLAQVTDHGLYGRPLPLHYVVRTTPSSMHSFAALAPHLDGGPFVLTTVDTIFRTEEFARYVQAFSEAVAQGYDGLMGVTDYIDDALPILRRCLEQGNSRMRNFQRALVAEGCRLKAWHFSKVLDIDHATDIAKAEEFLSGDATCR